MAVPARVWPGNFVWPGGAVGGGDGLLVVARRPDLRSRRRAGVEGQAASANGGGGGCGRSDRTRYLRLAVVPGRSSPLTPCEVIRSHRVNCPLFWRENAPTWGSGSHLRTSPLPLKARLKSEARALYVLIPVHRAWLRAREFLRGNVSASCSRIGWSRHRRAEPGPVAFGLPYISPRIARPERVGKPYGLARSD